MAKKNATWKNWGDHPIIVGIMIVTSIVAALGTIVGIAVTKPKSESDGTTPISILETRNYFPYFIGSTWTYNISHVTDSSSAIIEKYSETVILIETGLGDKAQIIGLKTIGDIPINNCPYLDIENTLKNIWLVIDNSRIFQVCSREEAITIATSIVHNIELADTLFPIFLVPMKIGQLWKAFPGIAPRNDTSYQWLVEAIVDVSVPEGQYEDCFRLLLYTNPDSTIKWVCKGVGLVAWEYHHHGSINDYRVELSEYKSK
jgi:hypothetical protein